MSHSTSTLISSSSSSRKFRRSIHPLLQYDPDALNDGIQLIKLEYLEAETTKAPVPRNQEVPKEAFGRLTGRSVLVATSHAWFFQNHPDPYGEKLNIMRKELFPLLRKRFPRLPIVIFDDWHSCPQWPRFTKEENNRFKNCMDHMNSVYCYCDVVLFVEAPLPKLDTTVFSCDLVPSEHKWLHFIDTIQYLGGNNNKTVPIRKNDIVIEMANVKKLLTINILKERKVKTTISYLRRPYGRPNQTLAVERGWLYAERITVAIRMAAANPGVFDDVVMSNSLDLIIQICGWSNQLRKSARKEKKRKGSIAHQLELFRATLGAMKFTFPNDHKLVNKIMTDLVTQFKDNWDEETRRQKNMATRTREILLRWGCFSEDYVERAELLCDSKNCTKDRRSWILLGTIIGVIAPMIAVLPYVFELKQHGEDPSREGLVVSSLWLGFIQGTVAVLLLHSMNLSFAKIPIGRHTVYACVALILVNVLISIVLRSSLTTIVPFEVLFLAILGFVVGEPLLGMLKFIPVKDKRTRQVKRWAIGTWLHMPASHRFDLKARAAVKRNIQTASFTSAFGLTYPLLGGLFFQSGIFIQALLIPVFFVIRAGFEYGADALTAQTFGSDGMPAINFLGVLMHEICLSVMITSIKHPLVFVSLVMSDVLENSFCLWSLAKNTKHCRVSPADDVEEEEEGKPARYYTKRYTNVATLVMNKDDVSDKGTALFIAATLFQREAVETLVPIQAAAILSLLYKVDVKSNSIVSGWTVEDWAQSMTYIGVDLGVELVVFLGTILALKQIYPEFDAGRILRGLMRTHWVEMVLITLTIWLTNLVFQSTYAGMDMTMKFEWLSCKDKSNSTWMGGFEWEC